MDMPMPLLPPVTMATFPLTLTVSPPWLTKNLASLALGRVLAPSLDPFDEVVADAERVGHRGERRIHGADAGEEAGVDDVQVVELMRLAVGVEHRGLRVGPEAAGARLVRDAADADLVLHVEVPPDQVMRVHAEVVEH